VVPDVSSCLRRYCPSAAPLTPITLRLRGMG
jgi:hypothetical protein